VPAGAGSARHRPAAPTTPQRRGEPDAALRSFAEALRIRKAVLGAAHPEIAVILNNLAALQGNQGP
jgi:hypothetical protein